MLVERLTKGADAFIAGHVLARELASRQANLRDLQRSLQREDPAALAAAAAGLAVTSWAFLKERELALLFGAGALVGSGVLEKGLELLIQRLDRSERRIVDVEPGTYQMR